MSSTILSNIIVFLYDEWDILNNFLSGIVILIPHRGLVIAQQIFISFKVENSF